MVTWYESYNDDLHYSVGFSRQNYHEVCQGARLHSAEYPGETITVYRCYGTFLEFQKGTPQGKARCIRFMNGLPILGGGAYIPQVTKRTQENDR